jgi:hypothetical protein
MREATERVNATQTGTPIEMRGIISAHLRYPLLKETFAPEIGRHAGGRDATLDSHGAGNRVAVQ